MCIIASRMSLMLNVSEEFEVDARRTRKEASTVSTRNITTAAAIPDLSQFGDFSIKIRGKNGCNPIEA